MGASDYMVGSAPQGASYAAPLVGMQLGQEIASYPQAYMQGRENQRTIALQNAFPNGIPTAQDGSPDVNAITGKLAQIGGGQYVQQLMPYLLNAAQGQRFSQGLSGLDNYVAGGAPNMPQATSRQSASATGPANVTSQPQATAQDQPTVMKILASQGIPNDQLGAASESVARQLGVGPTDPINPADPQVRNVLGPAIQQLKKVGQVQPQQPGDNGQPQQVAQTAQPQQPAQQPQAQPQPSSPNDEGVPGADEGTMKRLAFAAGRLRAAAAGMAATNPAQAQALENQAKAYDDRAKQIFDTMAASRKQEYEHELSAQDLTPEEKNARNPNVQAAQTRAEQQKVLVTSRGKTADKYITAGEQADKAIDMNRYALKLANSPDFISGAGKTGLDAIANVSQSLGLGQSASVGQIFDKIRSSTVLDGIRSMAGTGPVRVAEMKVIEQASGDRANQAESIRAVLIMQQRAYQKQMAIRDVVRQHNGVIDGDAEKQIDQIMAKPLFSDAEMKDPHALGAPTFNSPQEIAAAHYPYGRPFRTPNGDIKYNWQHTEQQAPGR